MIVESEHWADFARRDIDAWCADIAARTSPEQRVDLAHRLLIAAAQIGHRTQETKYELFLRGQQNGFHFLPVHFYNPIPDTSAIPESTWDQRYDDIPGVGVAEDRALELLDELAAFGEELSDVPDEGPGYCWNNDSFAGGDASLLYAMVRKFKPQTILEIGSGRSTHIGLKALEANGAGKYICIEPFPNDSIRMLAESRQIELRAQFVQTVPLEAFEALEAGDILFIDSTHVAQVGTDVTYEILKILPRLKSGVIIHVHDIFLPYEFPRSWVLEKLLFWNEQHMLAAFLAFNRSFKPLISNGQVAREERLRNAAQAAFPHAPVHGGGSFWLRRESA